MILVTGGAGYIGSHAVRLLLEKGYKVAVVDNLSRGYRQVIDVLQKEYGKENLDFYRTDLSERSKLTDILKKTRPEAVMHFGALCSVSESVENPELYFENNMIGSLNLLKAMKKTSVGKLIFSSTSEVYGENQYLPLDEKHRLLPVNPYGLSKLMVEQMIPYFVESYVIFRYFNATGASDDGLIGDSKNPSTLLVQNAVRGALGIEEFRLTCPKVKTRDGSTIRDYVDVVDLARGHVMALDYLREGNKSEVFNLGTGKGSSVLEIVESVKKTAGVDFEVGTAEPRKGEVAEKYADYSKARMVLGWEPKKGIEDSIKSLIKWYKGHPNGWEKR